MARTRLVAVIAIVAVVLGIALVAFAQGGPGRGRGMGAGCAMGQCGQCPLAQAAGMQGGWWTRVKAQTPDQQAFIDQVAKLHEQIRDERWALATLQAQNALQADIDAAQAQLSALQTQLRALMTDNAAICKQLGGPDCANCQGCPCGCCGMGRGQGMGMGTGQGRGMGMGQGGWWNWVQPQTPAEKAFVADVKSLHDQILAAQAAGDQAAVTSLRAKLHDVMYANQALHQQMMMSSASPKGPGMGMGRGRGGAGMGMGRGCGGAGCPMRQ